MTESRKRGAGASRRGFLKGAAAAAGGAAATIGGAGAAPYKGGAGSMMFIPGHSMIGAHSNAPGAPSDDEV